MGLKPRIKARTEAPPVYTPKPLVVPEKRAAAKLFGEPLNIQKIRAEGPKILGYVCVASWEVIPTDDQIMAFLELEQALGNVQRMYHGTKVHSVEAIVSAGLRKGYGGMFGGGIYMGGIHKAINYAHGKPTRNRDVWQAHYVLEIDAVLGKILACMTSDHSLNLGKVKGLGCDSVGGFANQTISWGGKLRHNEYVVYDSKQVLIRRIHEYQTNNAPLSYQIQTQGLCQVVVEVEDPKMPRTFKDVLSKRACGKVAYNNLGARYHKEKHNTRAIWICAKCIEEGKLRVGSRVSVARMYGGYVDMVLT